MSLNNLVCFLILFSNFLFGVVLATGERGSACLDSSSCNAQKGFICDETTHSCQCVRNSLGWDTYYDEVSKSCLAHIDFSCDEHRKCPDNSTCKTKLAFVGRRIPAAIRKVVENFHLVYDRETRKCICNEGLASFDSKTCAPILKFGDSCSTDLAVRNLVCDPTAFLHCGSSGTCTCSDSTYYDENMKMCVTRVGEACTWITQCENNAMCSALVNSMTEKVVRQQFSSAHIKLFYPYEDRTVKNSCQCLPGYSTNHKGKCVASYQVECSEESPCNADRFLTCVDGRCQCEEATMAIFSESKNETCYLQAGASCATDNSGPNCFINSACINGQCVCNSGYYKAASGKCLSRQTHGMKCNAAGGDACNNFLGLACKNQHCVCLDKYHEWNPILKQCEANVGKRCGKIYLFDSTNSDVSHHLLYPRVTSGLTEDNAYFVKCVDNLECKAETQGYPPICTKRIGGMVSP